MSLTAIASEARQTVEGVVGDEDTAAAGLQSEARKTLQEAFRALKKNGVCEELSQLASRPSKARESASLVADVFFLLTRARDAGVHNELFEELDAIGVELVRAGLYPQDLRTYVHALFTRWKAGTHEGDSRKAFFRALVQHLESDDVSHAFQCFWDLALVVNYVDASDRDSLRKALEDLRGPLRKSRDMEVAGLLYDLRQWEAMDTLHRTALSKRLPRQALIAVLSRKGGVGKSLLATALSVELASRGRKVCLLDCDFAGPSIAFYLPFERPTRGRRVHFLHEILRSETDTTAGELDKFLLTPCMHFQRGRLQCILSSLRPEDLDVAEGLIRPPVAPEKPRKKLSHLLEDLHAVHHFDHIVLDCSPGLLSTAYLSFATVVAMGGNAIIMTTPSAADIFGLVVEMRQLVGVIPQPQQHLAIVLNRCNPAEYSLLEDKSQVLSLLSDCPERGLFFPRVELERADLALAEIACFVRENIHWEFIPFIPGLRYAGHLHRSRGAIEVLTSLREAPKFVKATQSIMEWLEIPSNPPRRKSQRNS